MQFPGLNIGIIADDLTGACDTALQFYNAETHPQVLLNPKDQDQISVDSRITHSHETQVWSLNTQSRHRDPSDSEQVVKKTVKFAQEKLGIENFYKKIDSTLRGNLAQECLAALTALNGSCAVIAPAYPEEGRLTVGGYQLVRGIPIEKTEVSRDPLFPVRQSQIPSLLSEMVDESLVGYIPLSVVLHGAGPIFLKLKELIQNGKQLVVADATSQEDLEQIALAIDKGQKTYTLLPCGSAGLAQAMAGQWQQETVSSANKSKNYKETEPSPILIVSSSNTETTRTQLGNLLDHYEYYGHNSSITAVDLSPDQILGLSPIEPVIDKINVALGNHNTVIVSSALQAQSYVQTINLATEHQISPQEASQKVQQVLGEITRAIDSAQNRLKLVLVGGDTTESVCNALNVTNFKIIDQATQSIPLLEDQSGRWIVTKSGGFGDPLTIANVVQFLKQKELTTAYTS
ncbi:MAG: four-carbon acid sugar kinase family protein [Cyanobacteria bacterium P01_H01_bin.74]